MAFCSEEEMRTHLIARLKELDPDSLIVMDSQNVGDIVICRGGEAPEIFFLELKLYQPRNRRINLGDSSGRGFQPEVVQKRPYYLEDHLRWILCDGRQDEPSYVLTDTATIRRYLAGGGIGAKHNNIQVGILRELPTLSEDALMKKLRDFLTTRRSRGRDRAGDVDQGTK